MAKSKLARPKKSVPSKTQSTKTTKLSLPEVWFPAGVDFPETPMAKKIDWSIHENHLKNCRLGDQYLRELMNWIDLLSETTFRVGEQVCRMTPWQLKGQYDTAAYNMEETMDSLRDASGSIREAISKYDEWAAGLHGPKWRYFDPPKPASTT